MNSFNCARRYQLCRSVLPLYTESLVVESLKILCSEGIAHSCNAIYTLYWCYVGFYVTYQGTNNKYEEWRIKKNSKTKKFHCQKKEKNKCVKILAAETIFTFYWKNWFLSLTVPVNLKGRNLKGRKLSSFLRMCI